MGEVLPKGWVETDFGDIFSVMTNGGNFKQEDFPKTGYVPVSRIETIWNEFVDDKRVKYAEISASEFEKYKVRINDILFSHINSDKHLGKTAIYKKDIKLIHGINLLLLRTKQQVNSDFTNYFIRYYRSIGGFLDIAQRSVNQSSINQKKLSSIKIFLPPLAEQERIVKKLDTLFAQIEKMKLSLTQIPIVLKNFRQQVVTQAVTGKLTEKWREGKDLRIQRIDLIDKKTKKILNDKSQDYNLPLIPNSWKWSTISAIGDVKGGKRLPKGDQFVKENTGLPYIKAGDIKNGIIQMDKIEYLKPLTQSKIKRYTVQSGDILITNVGACIGDIGVVPHKLHNANQTENALRICNLQETNNYFLSFWLRSAIAQGFIKQTILSAAQGKLALGRMEIFPIPILSVIEQQEIVLRIESLFAKADQIEARYKILKDKIENLPQTILHKAFKGELVAQLPTDGDAKDLLEEIKKLKIK